MYHVNSYKLHTTQWEKGNKTDITRVWIKEDTGDGKCDCHGVINEILELKYFCEPLKKVVLFNYKWYDPTHPGETSKYNHYKIIEFNHTKRYGILSPKMQNKFIACLTLEYENLTEGW